MTSTARWVRRLYHFNVTQLALNTILLFLLGTWYVGLPTEEDANRDLVEERLPVASLPEGAFDTLGAPAKAKARAPAAAARQAQEDPAMAALLAGAPDDPPPSGEEAGEDPGGDQGAASSDAAPGSGGKGGAAASTGPINAYLETSTQALRRAGSSAGVDVSPYLPTAEQWAAAVGTGDFFNAKTLVVLQRLKEGFKAAGAAMPAIPEESPGAPAPFDPTF